MVGKKIVLSESQEQSNFVAYCNINKIPVFSIPNGMWIANKKKAFAIIAKQRKEGLAKGIPDLMIPIANDKYHGLFIEFKRSNGSLKDVSQEQFEWLEKLNQNGYYATVAFGYNDALEILEKYKKGSDLIGS